MLERPRKRAGRTASIRGRWQHRRKRAVRDHHTLNLQRNRALAVVEGDKTVKATRFVKHRAVTNFLIRSPATDLRARPIFHHAREAIEAHLTIVFTVLAVARYLQTVTGVTIKALVKALRPMREVTITLGGHELVAAPQLTVDAQQIVDAFDAVHPQEHR